MERGQRAIYRRRESSKWSRSEENLRGELTGGEGSVTGGILGRRLKKALVLTRGPRLSARWEKEKGTDLGKARWATGWFLIWAERSPRVHLVYFFLFWFFLFAS
jgi:hypothetical protein